MTGNAIEYWRHPIQSGSIQWHKNRLTSIYRPSYHCYLCYYVIYVDVDAGCWMLDAAEAALHLCRPNADDYCKSAAIESSLLIVTVTQRDWLVKETPVCESY